MKKPQQKILLTILTSTMISSVISFNSVHATTSIITQRISGIDRYATADALSEKYLSADTVIIASGDNFPDALCAAPLAQKYNAPILLSSKSKLSINTLNEITRLNATKAIIIGGAGSVSVNIETQLTSIKVTSTRIEGKSRYDTSLLVAKQLSNPTAIVVAYGEDFPDALSISAIASQLNMPIILSGKTGLSKEAEAYIKNSGVVKTYVIGGTGVLSDNIEKQVPNIIRLAGANRYATNLKVLQQFSSVLNFDNMYLATGENFADALSGSVLAGKNSNPMILVGNDVASQKEFFSKNSAAINTITILGGTGAVTDNTVDILQGIDDNSSILTFPDKNLERKIRAEINKPIGNIFKSDVAKITTLDASDNNISDLSGIEDLTNLIDLILYNNKITNLDPLKKLNKLVYLNLSDNQISNLDGLSKLTSLVDLILDVNKITNLDALKGLTNLSMLYLNHNKIIDKSGLKGLTNLTDLDLGATEISNLDDLSQLTNLTDLNLSDNKINNLDALKKLTNLIYLDLSNNQITNIDVLRKFINLGSLSLDMNSITDFSPTSSYYDNLEQKDFKL